MQILVRGFAGSISKFDINIVIGHTILVHASSLVEYRLSKNAALGPKPSAVLPSAFNRLFKSISLPCQPLEATKIALLSFSNDSNRRPPDIGVPTTSRVTFQTMLHKTRLDPCLIHVCVSSTTSLSDITIRSPVIPLYTGRGTRLVVWIWSPFS